MTGKLPRNYTPSRALRVLLSLPAILMLACGGYKGTSPPTLTAISPATMAAGSPSFTLTATGTNFSGGAQILLGGAPEPTTVVSSTQLTATVPVSLLSQPGVMVVEVRRPDAALSNALELVITGQQTAPALTAITPASVAAGSSDFTLTATGTGFVSSSAIALNGVAITTVYDSATQLHATVAAAQIAVAGTLKVGVLDPSNRLSNELPLIVTPNTTPAISITPQLIDFGGVEVGTASAAATVTVTNNYSLPVTLLSIAATLPDYSISSACPESPSTLAVGASCTINVTFTPTVAGVRTDTLTVVHDGPGSPAKASLTGTGTAAGGGVTLLPTSLSWGNATVGQSAGAKNITVTNNVGQPLAISSIAATLPDYTVSSTCPVSPSTLAVGASCLVTVTFTPSAVGLRSDTLTLAHDAPGSPATVSLSGTGTSAGAGITLSPTSLLWGNTPVGQAAGAKTVTVTNSLNIPVTISSISAVLHDYSVTSSCPVSPSTLAAGANCLVTVNFTPSTIGARSDTLSVVHDGPGSPTTASLSGTGVAAGPGITLSPTALDWGSAQVGQSAGVKTVTLSNTFNLPVTISSIASTLPDYAVSSTCPVSPSTLAVGMSCLVAVNFTPSVIGARSDTLSVVNDAPGSPATASLSGIGIPSGAGITVSPTSLSWGNAPIGQAAGAKTVTVTNTFNLPVTISSISTALPDYSVSSTCPTSPNTLAVGANCIVTVNFTPSVIGVRSDNLTVTHDGPGSPATVLLSGTGTSAGPGISLSPTALDWGNAQVGQAAGAKTVTITNNFSQPVTISSIAATLPDYSVSSTCPTSPSTLAVGASCVITINFTPSVLGVRSDTLTVTHDAPGSPATASLTGTGIPAGSGITVSPTSLSWGNAPVGQAAGAKTVTVTNSFSQPVTISSISAALADYSVTSNCPTSPSTLAVGANCTITVNFTPSVVGIRSDTLTVAHDAPGSPSTVLLSGTGISAGGGIALSPTSLSWGNAQVGQAAGAKTVTVTNTFSQPVTISSIVATLPDYSVSSTCPVSPSTLAVGANCTITVNFTPSAVGLRSDTLSVVHDATGSPATVSLTGTGVPAGTGITVSPNFLSWGNVQVGQTAIAKTVTVTNTYSQPVTISSIATTLPDYSASSTCPASPGTLAVGANCTITVNFTPSQLGARSDTLTVVHDAPGSPATVPLSGTGTPVGTGVSLLPTSLSWGSAQIGQSAGAKTVMVTNNTGSAVSFSSITVGPDYAVTASTCVLSPGTLAAGTSCNISIAFQPQAQGLRPDALTLTDNGPASPQQVSLSGTGVVGPAIFAPTSLSFPSTSPGSVSPSQTATLTNQTANPLNLSGIAIASNFVQTNDCPGTLAAGASCTFTVSFAPTPSSGATGTLRVNDGSGVLNLYLTGIIPGGGGTLSFTPRLYQFPKQATGTSSAPFIVTLTNSRSVPVNISSIQANPPFSQTNTCGTTIAPGGSCTMAISFSPMAASFYSSTVVITSDAPGSPQSVSVSGSGVMPVSTVPVVGGLYFNNQIVQTPSTPLPVTFTNNESSPVTFSSISTPADFTFSTDCPNNGGALAAGATCTVQVTFFPQAVGNRNGQLTVVESALGSPLVIPLAGLGIAGQPGTTVNVKPFGPCVKPLQPQQFTALVTGLSNTSVYWFVDNVPGGNHTLGTITTSGLYTPPNNNGSHVIKAVSQVSNSVAGTSPIFVSAAPSFGISPYVASLAPGGQQTFQAQVCTVPDSSPVTYTVNGIAGGNATVGTVTTDGIYTAPATTGKYTVAVTDAGLSRTSGAVVNVYSAITADFASRGGNTIPIPANMFGAGRGEAMHSVADRNLLTNAGLNQSRLYAQIPLVYATPTPDWTKIDPLIASVQAAGQRPLLQLDLTPPWLQPNPNPCGAGNDLVVPKDLNQWANIAASYVAHMDANFPDLVQDYEIWNEPNALGMCSRNHLASYIALYAAAAPAMKAQAAADGKTIRVGGPVLSSYSALWINTLLNTASTAPYVDFISYHQYMFGSNSLQVQWDTYTGDVSLYQATQDPSLGPANYYNKVLALAKAGQQPLGGNTPIYITEFNTNWAFFKDCCRDDATLAPVWNTMYVTDLLNTAYSGATMLPNKMYYFASGAYPWFCLVGVLDANMDCLYSAGSTPAPYPQYYAFQLMASSTYLGLVNGGFMAQSITPPSGGGGLVTTAFYTANQDSILITNPTATAYSQMPINFQNAGFTAPQGTLYQIVNGASINSSSVALTQQGSNFTTAIDIPAYSVQAIALKGP